MYEKLRVILALAIPAIVENILQTVVGFVDTLFVSRLGLVNLTAVGVTNSILAIYIAVFMALGVGTSSLISRSIGAGDLTRAKAIARQSTWISGGIGLLFGLITLFLASPLLEVMGAEPEVLQAATVYFRIVGMPAVFLSLMTIFGSILRASGDTKSPMRVGLWMNAAHIVLDYLLIFGLWSVPGLGLAGAAWSTVLVRAVSTVALYWKIRQSPVSFHLFGRSSGEERATGKELLTLSTPTAIERLVMRGGQVLYFGLIVHLGTSTFAAHTIAGNIESFAYMPGYGLAIAATTLVGKSMGAKQERDAYSYAMLTTAVGVVIQAVAGIVLFTLTPWFAQWFTSDRDVIELVTTALRIDAFGQPALAVSLILAGALQGAGDTKSPMYSTLVGMWAIRIIGVYILGIHMQMGIAGVWLSIVIDLLIRAVYLYLRMKKRFQEGIAW
ncbi:MATE family efflux transporter [Tumebacillus sp. ITR2]|uniref:Probable multidrug resistance protein NorM n=1 Tax=Tumebacillus amylolyticus TaxID=2801339 RepID=A0ABS1J5J5_9BACL|nr:MATE family efflux transporter [Tumebacillus amylolyticus]MBL0385561.1 MATE family efflux transporter [Tumebacillus amylolyticus]